MRDIQAATAFIVSLAFSIIAIFSPLSAIPASLFLIAAVVIFLAGATEKKKDEEQEQARAAWEKELLARVDRLEKQIALQFGGKR